MNSNEVLRIRELSISTDGREVDASLVDSISFSVLAGKTVCLVGESGSGKSITSLAVMGLLPKRGMRITGGSVHLNGESVLDATKERIRQLRATSMAMIFQEPMTALNPVHKVGVQIGEVLRLHEKQTSLSDRRRKVVDMLRAVHIPDPDKAYESYPHQLSGGQRQRVMIAMALILKPALLIADEPTTALDVTTQKEILLLLDELKEQHGTAILFITHDFGVVSELADQIVVMKNGQVVETGTKEDVLLRPRDPYTKKLISAVPNIRPRPARTVNDHPVLEVSDLTKKYMSSGFFGGKRRTVNALASFDLTINKGEIVGIVGESGSGKSTAARCIVRLTDPSSGTVVLNGQSINGMRDRTLRSYRKHIQMIFQDPYRSLNPRLSVGRSLIEGLRNYRVPQEDAYERIRQVLDIVGIGAEALDRFPHQFSGGQRQRLCIARALVMEPDILICDEAVSALDVSIQAEVLKLLLRIRNTLGLSILFITHDLRVAADICDTIIVMKSGRIVERGSAFDVLTQPTEEYTMALLSAAPGRQWDFELENEKVNI